MFLFILILYNVTLRLCKSILEFSLNQENQENHDSTLIGPRVDLKIQISRRIIKMFYVVYILNLYLQLISYFACKILCKNVISCVKSCSNLHVTYIRGKKHGLGDSSKRCAQCSSNKRVRHELFFRYHLRADICSRNEKYTLTSDLPTPTSLRILIFHSTPSTLP